MRRDFQDHWRRVGIGLDVQPGKCKRAGGNKYEQAQQDQRPASQREYEKPLEQKLPPNPSLAPLLSEERLELYAPTPPNGI